MTYTEDQMTPWFSGDVKPARDGVYQRQYDGQIIYSKYVGGEWHVGKKDPLKAHYSINYSIFTSLLWRGLNFNAEAV